MTASAALARPPASDAAAAAPRPALVVVNGGAPRNAAPPFTDERWLQALPAAARVLSVQPQADGLAAAYQARHPGSQWHTVDLSGRSGTPVLPDGVFDLIVLADLLPWLADPLGLLQALAQRIHPQGRLLVRTEHHGSPRWLQRWLDGDLSVEPREALSTGQPRLMSVANLFKLMMDAGWMPHLVDAEPAAPLPAPAQTALTQLRASLGHAPGGCAERVQGLDTLFIEGRPSFAQAARLPGAALFDVLVPTNDERQLRVNVEASPGLREVQAQIVSCRGAAHPAEALAQGLPQLGADWVLICHQDVYFPAGFGEQLNALLAQIPAEARRHTLLGFVGLSANAATQAREPAGFVIDRLHRADHPASEAAVSLDELAIVVARDTVHRIDPALGWHLWATDLCLSAICEHRVFPRIVRLPLFHNSRTGWQLPEGFAPSARTLAAKWAGFGPIHTLCGVIDASA